MTSKQTAMATESLQRAQQNASVSNYPAIFEGFLSRGIPEEDIRPRENVLTYHAWHALGRQVRKGEHGVRVSTWIVTGPTQDAETGDVQPGHRMPKGTTVFHLSQTDPIGGM